MGDVQFTDRDLEFLASVESNLSLRCCCQFSGHNGFCDDEAAVTIKFHIPHLCRHPKLIEAKRIDDNGCVTQILCTKCYWETRLFVTQKIAQTIAITKHLSSICQHCGFMLRAVTFGVEQHYDVCPNCGTGRIEFHPVCGAGIRDSEGRSFGCGAPLQTITDLIRHEEWMRPQGKEQP